MIVATALRSLLLSYLRLVFVNMVLTTLEKTFIVEHYFRSYGNGRAGGPSLSQTALRFQEHFHKNPPSNAVILSVVEKFRRTGSDPPSTIVQLKEKITMCIRRMEQPHTGKGKIKVSYSLGG